MNNLEQSEIDHDLMKKIRNIVERIIAKAKSHIGSIKGIVSA